MGCTDVEAVYSPQRYAEGTQRIRKRKPGMSVVLFAAARRFPNDFPLAYPLRTSAVKSVLA
jgi:hypothetical protein